MNLDEIEIKPKLSKKMKLDKNVILLVALVTVFLLAIAYVFNLEEDKPQIKDTEIRDTQITKNFSEFDNKMINSIKSNQIKDVVSLPLINLNKEVVLPNFKKVEKIQETISKNDFAMENNISMTETLIAKNNNENKNYIKELKSTIKELKDELYLKNKMENKPQAILDLKNKNKKIKDVMKKYLVSINDDISIQDKYFEFENKNYYIGDKLNNYQIRDIRKNHIRFCNSKWCYTLRNYK